MPNSQNSSPNPVTHLWLPGHVTPSLNKLTGTNRFGMMAHRKKAQAALSSALHVTHPAPLTGTTFGEALRQFVTLSDTLDTYQTMTQKPSSPLSDSRSARKPKREPKF
jgi:hypothetical protein